MSLFKTEDLTDFAAPQVKQAGAVTVQLIERVIMGKINSDVEQVFPTLEHNTVTVFVSAGMWSTHDLVFHLMRFTGPAKVTFATWSITQEPCQMLINALDEGLITELNGLLDVRVKIRNPKVYQFAKMKLTKIRETVCHAKVTVIQNAEWEVCIVGSSNWTNNPRIESGVILESRTVADFSTGWIMAEIEKAHPFK